MFALFYFWGLLAIPFMKIVYVYIQNFANYLEKTLGCVRYKKVTAVCMMFMMCNCFMTMFALKVFLNRLIYAYDIDVTNKEEIAQEYQKLVSNEKLNLLQIKCFQMKKC